MSINRLPISWQFPNSTQTQSTAAAPAGLLLGTPSATQTRFRTILVPLDGTSHGESAVPLAVSIARQAGAQLRLLQVYAPVRNDFHPSTYVGVDRDLYRQQLEYVHRIARQIADASGVSVTAECLREQDVADGICRASDRGVDLVVAASRGHSWLERVWHGGTMHKLIERVRPPMLILRGNGLNVSIAPRRWLQRLLVPLDGSELAEQVFDPMIALGSLYQADYSLLTIVPDNDLRLSAYDESAMRQKQRAAEEYLSLAMYRMKRRAQEPAGHVAVTDESIATAIVMRARASLADCIVLSHAQRTGLERWFQPSVTHRVLQLSTVPLLVVKQTFPQ